MNNTIQIPDLETPRLRLRAFGHGDFDAYASMWKEAEVVRFIGGVSFTREAAWACFLRQMGAWHYLGFGFFAIEDKASRAFIGEAGFHDLHRNITPSTEGTLEAGWVLSTTAHGKGIAEEATRAALGLGRARSREQACDVHHSPKSFRITTQSRQSIGTRTPLAYFL